MPSTKTSMAPEPRLRARTISQDRPAQERQLEPRVNAVSAGDHRAPSPLGEPLQPGASRRGFSFDSRQQMIPESTGSGVIRPTAPLIAGRGPCAGRSPPASRAGVTPRSRRGCRRWSSQRSGYSGRPGRSALRRRRGLQTRPGRAGVRRVHRSAIGRSSGDRGTISSTNSPAQARGRHDHRSRRSPRGAPVAAHAGPQASASSPWALG